MALYQIVSFSSDWAAQDAVKNSKALSREQIEGLGFRQDHFRLSLVPLQPARQRYPAREHGRGAGESETECFSSDH